MRSTRVRIRIDDYQWLNEERLRRGMTTAELLHEIIEAYKRERSNGVGGRAASPFPHKEGDI